MTVSDGGRRGRRVEDGDGVGLVRVENVGDARIQYGSVLVHGEHVEAAEGDDDADRVA